MAKRCPKGNKTLWEKEKLLVTSPTVFSKKVYRRHVKNQGLFGEGLKHTSIWRSFRVRKAHDDSNFGIVYVYLASNF